MSLSSVRSETALQPAVLESLYRDPFLVVLDEPNSNLDAEGDQALAQVRDQVEVTTNTNVKVRYESYEEVRAALLEEGINVDKLPLLTDMRRPEGQERT